MDGLAFASIRWQSEQHQQAIDLRNRVLRFPLGLELSTDDMNAEQDHSHYGAFLGEQLTGCVIVATQLDTSAKIRQMAIEPSHQRAGIGTFLMQQVEEELIRQGRRRIDLHARKTAIGFYQKLGYTPQGKEFIEVTLPHVLMTKALES